jgi:5-oxoprolinase (ATP-hydrolysing)
MSRWKFAADTGGTFTDVIGIDPSGSYHTLKILSDSPDYEDASIEGVRRILGLFPGQALPEDDVESIRFGTTIATNAFLERKGGAVALFITEGFSDLLEIGYQERPDIFNLCIHKPLPLYASVTEVPERIRRDGSVLRQLNRKKLEADIMKLDMDHTDAVAVVLMHAWKNPEHELLCEKIFSDYNIPFVYLSHRVMNAVKIVSRGQSTVVDAYLSPVIARYVERIRKWTGNIRIEFMQSAGDLTSAGGFRGKNALLSGPAGGVIALGQIAQNLGLRGAIGFDMGGTSTDVTRYDGAFEKVFERVVEGIEFQTEMLNIHTVASGGGSTLWFDGGKMRVGPASAGAYPGPACYGFGGPLTITDANLIAGRIVPDYFPRTFGPERKSPVKSRTVREEFREMTKQIKGALKIPMTVEQAALGFLKIATEKMAMAIKEISVSRGFDVREYALVCFGGAGGQHACAVASVLGIKKIVSPPISSLLSAYGIGLARRSEKRFRTLLQPYHKGLYRELGALFAEMKKEILGQNPGWRGAYTIQKEVDLRPAGTDSFLTVPYGNFKDTVAAFKSRYRQTYGFYPDSPDIEIVNIRLVITERKRFFSLFVEKTKKGESAESPCAFKKVCFDDGPLQVPVYLRHMLAPGRKVRGPACIVESTSALVVDPGFIAEKDSNGMIVIEKEERRIRRHKRGKGKDPVLLEVFNSLFSGVATEMGYVLKNTAFSVNMKERRDFSCAIFDRQGNLVANAPHIPVHIGSMTDTVRWIMKGQKGNIRPGDMFLSNDPYKGGAHLPDLTVICPVFAKGKGIIFFTAARGHHADIGGISPGSLPPQVDHVDKEGVIIDSFLLVRNGAFREKEIRNVLTSHPFPVRNIRERILDLEAQIASCHKGKTELEAVIDRYGLETITDYMQCIQQNAAFSVKQALWDILAGRDSYEAFFEDYLDDGSLICVKITVSAGKTPPLTVTATVDFTGTSGQHAHDSLNAPLSVTRSAVMYVLRSLGRRDIPLNSGCLAPIKMIVPARTLLNPSFPAPVATGNVETSQRIVDVLLGAFNVCAASQGTMNNFIFEVDGDSPYYETVGGGAGAMKGCHGASGVQVHMTNTRITDPEILEFRHPGVRLVQFRLRRGSGGRGRFQGGEGIIREILFLLPSTVSIISERRKIPPYGLCGGKSGAPGDNMLSKADGSRIRLPHRVEMRVAPGDSVLISTPGGGGFGRED